MTSRCRSTRSGSPTRTSASCVSTGRRASSTSRSPYLEQARSRLLSTSPCSACRPLQWHARRAPDKLVRRKSGLKGRGSLTVAVTRGRGPDAVRHDDKWEGTPEMSNPRGILRSIAAVAISVAALTATTATDAHAADVDVEQAAVAADDSSSSALRTKEERTK